MGLSKGMPHKWQEVSPGTEHTDGAKRETHGAVTGWPRLSPSHSHCFLRSSEFAESLQSN